MNKIKKVFISFSMFTTGLVSKVFAVDIKYGIVDPEIYENKYGVFQPTIDEKISTVGKIGLPIILFIIGLFVILNKKIQKKTKTIIISILVIVGILTWLLFNYIVNNLKLYM